MKPRVAPGFSILELMISISIFAVLIVLGIPTYQQWLLNTRIRTASESIQNGLRLARNEAVQRGTNVMFDLTNGNASDWSICLWSTGAACPATGSSVLQSYNSGDGTTGVLVTTSAAIASVAANAYKTTVTGTGGSVIFNSLGRPSSYNGTSLIRIDTSATQAGSRRLMTTISAGGEVNMCDTGVAFTATSTQGCQ